MQKYTSANTSLNQIPKTGKLLEKMNLEGYTILDYGCGKYDTFKMFCESLGMEYYGYDKFNRSMEENTIAMNIIPNIVTCNNVLNVIEELPIIEQIVKELSVFNCQVIIKVYEGNKSGIGKNSKNDCFQRNMRGKDYLPIISKFFENIIVKGDILICQ